jgi:hypothetical protein
MVFDHAMEFEIDEYLAPPLAEQARMHQRAMTPRGGRERADAPGGGGGLTRQASTSELSRQQSDGMDTVVIQRLQQWISESRDDLQYYFERKDPRGRGTVSPAVWREGLTNVLKLTQIPLVQYRAFHLPFFRVSRHIAPRSSDKTALVLSSQNRGW